MFKDAEDDWQKQLQHLADNKKNKHEDREEKMKKKNETELIIDRVLNHNARSKF